MTRPQRTRVAVLALALLLVAASVGTGAAAGQTTTETATHTSVVGPADGPATAGPITRCFAGEGYPISIGDGGGSATMETVLHLSVLTDPAAGSEFGLEAAGRPDGEPIVTLAVGVRLTAREALANGVDPFAAFDILYTYELRLPMFDGAADDAGYKDDGAPIDSTAGTVAC